MKHYQTLRRGLGILFALAICLILQPATALAADPVADTADFVNRPGESWMMFGGSSVAWWNSSTNTLTLKGVNFSTTAATAVKLPEGTTIVLEGENTITSLCEDAFASSAIYAVDGLTIQGDGKLTVNSAPGQSYSCGIRVESGNMTISDAAQVNAAGEGQGHDYGIYVPKGNVTISGGTVTATGGDKKYDYLNSYGIYAGGSITISGGHVIAQTLVEVSSEKCMALNKEPNLSAYTGYKWRTNSEEEYTVSTAEPYSYDVAPTYVEFSPCDDAVDFTDDPSTAQKLLGGTSVAEWNSSTSTLTLKGVNFTTSAATAVKLPEGTTIVLKGDNTIVSMSENTDVSYGIYTEGDLEIQGDGSLTARGGKATGEQSQSYGIYAGNSVDILSGNVTAKGGEATGEQSQSCGIYAVVTVKIYGGNVTAKGGETSGGFDQVGFSQSCGIGTTKGKIYIYDGSVEATGGKSTYGSHGISSEFPSSGGGETLIYGGTVKATGGTGERSYGISADMYLAIYDGTVIATGNEANYSYGLFAVSSITLKDGSVKATGGKSTRSSFGIYSSYGNVNCYGGIVTATSSEAEIESLGIASGYATVYIRGGIVTATSGAVTGTNGKSISIHAYRSIKISGGHLIAQTLAKESATTTRMALDKEPDLSACTGYYWRISSDDPLKLCTEEAYTYSTDHTYVEFSGGYTYTISGGSDGVTISVAALDLAEGVEITIIAAQYRDTQMVDARAKSITGACQVIQEDFNFTASEGDSYKVFLLSSAGAPLCAAKSLTLE